MLLVLRRRGVLFFKKICIFFLFVNTSKYFEYYHSYIKKKTKVSEKKPTTFRLNIVYENIFIYYFVKYDFRYKAYKCNITSLTFIYLTTNIENLKHFSLEVIIIYSFFTSMYRLFFFFFTSSMEYQLVYIDLSNFNQI